MQRQEEKKEKFLPAMEAAGYYFDEKGSTDDHLRFVPDGVHQLSVVLYADSWDDVETWFGQGGIDDQFTAERIQRVLYPERFEKSSEEMMYEDNGERFSIYQIKEGSKAEQYRFLGMDYINKEGLEVVAADYECVYSGILLKSDDLETLYSMFNDLPPADFKAHSMSVSDVVVMNRNHELRAYYVDQFGFTELPAFALERKAELGIGQLKERVSHLDEDPNIRFYVAECSEFPVLGEYHQDLSLQEAFRIYDSIPPERMHGIKCIGFDLKDGSDYEGEFELVSGNRVQKETINSIPYFRENVHVQKAIAEAEKELKKHDLGIKKASEEEPSNDYDKGEIKSQKPGAGEKAKKNSTVTVVISSGEAAEKVQVPNVVDKSEAEAEKLLQDAGLKVTKGEPQNSDTIAAGNVISSDPAANTEVDEGTSVTIVISLGKEDVKVPDLRNHSAADAESALAAVGLVGGASQDYSDTVPAGNVISQSPDPGSSVEAGSTVNYVVSLGPKTQTVEVPDVLKSYPDTAE